MMITRIETDIIPNTLEGNAFAKEYIEKLKSQGAFRKCLEDTNFISVTAEYRLELKADRSEEE